jgi:mannose-6-phosphate isomerase-like protein (cupin superfamily)
LEEQMRSVAIGLSVLALASQVGALAAPAAQPTYISAGEVAKAFGKGAPLVETDLYKVHASRREAPGMAEVHEHDTDIIHVLKGTAVIVTGGRVVDGRTTAAGEIRGRAIDGGARRRLGEGDVFIVPGGVPHQFTEVQAPLLYYVVKATAAGGGR